MKEAVLAKRILARLNCRHGLRCRAVKLHVGPFNPSGEPDIHGCYRGRAFFIEVKAGSRKTTPLQDHCLKEWVLAGAVVAVAREDFDVEAFLLRMDRIIAMIR